MEKIQSENKKKKWWLWALIILAYPISISYWIVKRNWSKPVKAIAILSFWGILVISNSISNSIDNYEPPKREVTNTTQQEVIVESEKPSESDNQTPTDHEYAVYDAFMEAGESEENPILENPQENLTDEEFKQWAEKNSKSQEDFENKTLESIANQFSLSIEEVRAIINKVIKYKS